MSDGAPSKKDTVIAGVPLSQYVAIYASVGEGFPLETALAHEGLDLETWPAIDRAWSDALVESADGDLELIDAHDSVLLAAQDRFWRSIPPISEDLAPWLAFFRRVTESEDPLALLATLRLRPTDLMRLHRRWSDRIALEKPLQEQALALLGSEPGPLPTVEPEPVVMPPPVGGGVRAAAPVAAVASEKTNGVESPPPLLAPLPPPPSTPPGRGAKGPAGASSRGGPSSIAPSAAKPGGLQPPSLTTPSLAPLPPPPQPGARLGLVSYAAACAEATAYPERATGAWAKFGLVGPAIAVEHDAWRTQFERYPEERVEFERHLEQMKAHWRLQQK